GDVSVQQKPLIQVALLKEKVSIPCEVIFPYTLKYTRFTVFYYWINAWDQEVSIYNKKEQVDIPPGEENKTAIKSYSHKTKPLESTSSTGTYYCKVQWDDIQIKGKGVFVLVRGIVSTYIYSVKLPSAITTTESVHAFLCENYVADADLWLQGTPGFSTHRDSEIEHRVAAVGRPANLCLDSQQVEVYSVLKNNTKIPEHRKSPPDKTPKKQGTLEEYSDTLYENI
ncbi:UNVERIFIED_CONTAM: hypothetical protein H355_012609, partial [Colinus virginianus]